MVNHELTGSGFFSVESTAVLYTYVNAGSPITQRNKIITYKAYIVANPFSLDELPQLFHLVISKKVATIFICHLIHFIVHAEKNSFPNF